MRKPDPVRVQRVEFVLRLILQGAQTWDIATTTRTDGEDYPAGHGKAWRVTDDTIRGYMRSADALIAKEVETNRKRLMGYHHATRRTLFNRALQANDTRTALAVLDSEAKLLRLFDAPPAPDPTGMTDEQIDAEVRELTAPERPGEAGGAALGAGDAGGGGEA